MLYSGSALYIIVVKHEIQAGGDVSPTIVWEIKMLLFFMKHMASVLVWTVFRILVLLECRLVSKPGVNERNLYSNIIYGQEKLHKKLSDPLSW